ncbi:MAG: copper-containing nitrite reductase [Chloroflexota bacterium]
MTTRMNNELSRRGFMKRAAAIGLAVPTVGALLSACGDDEESTVDTASAQNDESQDNDAAAAEEEESGAASDAVRIVKDPADIPGPINRSEPERVVVELETVELDGWIDEETSFTFWTFNGTVPGPMIRVREGDTVEIRLKNNEDSMMPHNIDLHAAHGPGGGAEATTVSPGEERAIEFKALYPGLYVYHCAVPHIPTHIGHGMYGLILVEPEAGLPEVDREFYLMQGEFYTDLRPNKGGHAEWDGDAQWDEKPNYVLFNGQFQGLTGENAMQANVGERVRLFVGNGGPNLVSSFHVIGGIMDVLHRDGQAEASHNVETVLIPAGGSSWMEFDFQVPGDYTLVDHSISRAIDKGGVAIIHVEGDENPEIFNPLDD